MLIAKLNLEFIANLLCYDVIDILCYDVETKNSTQLLYTVFVASKKKKRKKKVINDMFYGKL